MSRVPATARPTAILILSLILAACSETPAASSAEETVAPTPSAAASESASPEASESAEASGEAAVVTADSDLGAILTDAAGMTIYFFANDTEGTSNCEGDCLANWPAVEAEDSPTAGEGVTAELGTIERSDGTRQLTVNGFPAYYFANDAAAGDVNGQGVGGVWWVFGADGEHIES
jgi:predicted lipoprotein with Yx(FWY)xxD motif